LYAYVSSRRGTYDEQPNRHSGNCPRGRRLRAGLPGRPLGPNGTAYGQRSLRGGAAAVRPRPVPAGRARLAGESLPGGLLDDHGPDAGPTGCPPLVGRRGGPLARHGPLQGGGPGGGPPLHRPRCQAPSTRREPPLLRRPGAAAPARGGTTALAAV